MKSKISLVYKYFGHVVDKLNQKEIEQLGMAVSGLRGPIYIKEEIVKHIFKKSKE